MKNTQEIKPEVLRFISRSIVTDKCVLVLGPDIYTKEINNEIIDRTSFFNYLQKNNSDKRIFFEKEGVLRFDDSEKFEIWQEVENFYSGKGDIQLLETIANIKFPLIINASPDECLEKYLRNEMGIKVLFEKFDGEQDENKEVDFSDGTPLIYNVFGIGSDAQTQVITHESLFKKMQEILPMNSFPLKVRNFLRNSNCFLFLGFKFDSWTYQLLSYKIINGISDTNKEKFSSLEIKGDSEDYSSQDNIIMSKVFGMKLINTTPLLFLGDLLKSINGIENGKSKLREVGYADKYSAYISYAAETKNVLENISYRFKEILFDINLKEKSNTELQLLHYKDDPNHRFGSSIDSYVTRLGKGKTVILIVNDDYLKSEVCMQEALIVYNNHDNDGRVFFVILAEQDKLNFIEEKFKIQERYYDYWQERLIKITSNKGSDAREIAAIISIRDFIFEFISKIFDTNSLVLNEPHFVNDIDRDVFIYDIINKMKEV